jgi:hypothetical protein
MYVWRELLSPLEYTRRPPHPRFLLPQNPNAVFFEPARPYVHPRIQPCLSRRPNIVKDITVSPTSVFDNAHA